MAEEPHELRPPEDQGAIEPADPSDLLPLVYDELRALAEVYLRSERPGHTLQPTALVHEAYLRLADRKGVQWRDRAHFYRVAAKTMRRILVNHAISHGRQKRGGGRERVPLDTVEGELAQESQDLVALSDTLDRLSAIDEQKGQVVELRFFGGCTIEETAQALGISTATVERDWRLARAWLGKELS